MIAYNVQSCSNVEVSAVRGFSPRIFALFGRDKNDLMCEEAVKSKF